LSLIDGSHREGNADLILHEHADPEAIVDAARTAGLAPSDTRRIDLPTGKSFQLLRFLPVPDTGAT